uniref:NADH dehydrogenase subunit 6 n=1 Tax=Achatinella mustelina TaxID=115943 RepID=A0A336U881_9EUPU|nr:NADH dehydrogenase subunit 6 [Achatinella mustelina]ANC62892.1 NADH dehydrogenase subunit 6 [Achatinella mustelina]
MSIIFFLTNMFLMSYYWITAPIVLLFLITSCSMLLSILMGLLHSAWYGYILFLLYVGGVLVLFMYTVILSSNMKTKFISITHMMFLIMLSLVMTLMVKDFSMLQLGVSITLSSKMMNMYMFMLMGIVLLLVMLSILHLMISSGKKSLNVTK